MTEQPDTPVGEARRWLGIAHDDIMSAETILRHQETAFRICGFLAQQAAEKALKSVLAAHNLPVPKIHDLADLYQQLPVPVTMIDPEDLDRLNPWITDGRYPANLPEATKTQAEELVGAAKRVVAAVEGLISPQG